MANLAKQGPTSAKPSSSKGITGAATLITIAVLVVLAIIVYKFVFGAPGNFVDNDPSKDPLDGNYLGIIYKGGFIVPILLSTFFIVLVFSIERFITIAKASGSGNIDNMVRVINDFLDKGNIQGAIDWCDRQKGSVANVVRSGLHKYSAMTTETGMATDQKVLAIQKEVEEATSLEMPMLEKNLSILATIASIATLLGLLGTVLGMIRSFAALATAGAADSTALATGISEALINTALGIGTSALAIIAYNYFTGRIDSMTYKIDEAGYALTTNFAAKHK